MYECIRPDDWSEYSLFDIAFWKNGLAFKNIDFAKSGRPVIKIAELKNGVTSQTALTMAEYDPSVFVRRGDMLFSWSGNPDTSIDVFRWKGEDGWLNQHVFKVIPRTGVTDDFLFFLLKWLKPRFAEIARNKQTTGLGHVTIKDLKQMLVGIPDSKEQERIVRIIGPIQEKIELNREINETLEAMARALFKDWFVDFGPTRAKMEGREPYLAPEIWDLFPDALNDEGLPCRWRVGRVGDCFHLTMGQSPPGSTYNDDGEGLPFFQGRTDFGFRYPENRKWCTAPTRIAECDDTLVSVRAPVGDINMVWEKSCAGRGVAILRHRSGARSFTYYSAWTMQQELKQYEHTGTVFGAINKKQFEALNVVEPTPGIVTVFERKIGPLDDRIRKNFSESKTLAQTRDLLLPKLVSGEIRLADAEKEVVSVA